MAILGILAGAAIVLLNPVAQLAKARDAQRKNDLRQIQIALDAYYSDNNKYPPSGPGDCNWSSWACWSDFNNFTSSGYITTVPRDPQNRDLGNCGSTPNCHVYRYCNPAQDKYILAVNLEAPNNSPMSNNGDCSTGGPNYYWISN